MKLMRKRICISSQFWVLVHHCRLEKSQNKNKAGAWDNCSHHTHSQNIERMNICMFNFPQPLLFAYTV